MLLSEWKVHKQYYRKVLLSLGSCISGKAKGLAMLSGILLSFERKTPLNLQHHFLWQVPSSELATWNMGAAAEDKPQAPLGHRDLALYLLNMDFSGKGSKYCEHRIWEKSASRSST